MRAPKVLVTEEGHVELYEDRAGVGTWLVWAAVGIISVALWLATLYFASLYLVTLQDPPEWLTPWIGLAQSVQEWVAWLLSGGPAANS